MYSGLMPSVRPSLKWCGYLFLIFKFILILTIILKTFSLLDYFWSFVYNLLGILIAARALFSSTQCWVAGQQWLPLWCCMQLSFAQEIQKAFDNFERNNCWVIISVNMLHVLLLNLHILILWRCLYYVEMKVLKC